MAYRIGPPNRSVGQDEFAAKVDEKRNRHYAAYAVFPEVVYLGKVEIGTLRHFYGNVADFSGMTVVEVNAHSWLQVGMK